MTAPRAVHFGRFAEFSLLAIVTAAILYLTLGLAPGDLQGHPATASFSLRPFQNVRFIASQASAGKLLTPKVAYEVLSIVGNVGFFWLWGFAALHAFSRRGNRSIETAIVTVLLGVALSIGIEMLQTFLPERAADIDDVIANVTGAAAGVAHAFVRRRIAIEWS